MQWILLAIVVAIGEDKPLVSVPGLVVPKGFVVTEFADQTLANDIYVMTIDPKGMIIVAGRGYIRILIDDDNDGKADRAIQFSDTPKDGAMGLLWEGDRLYFTGDGMLGYFEDKNHDDKADGPPTKILKLKTSGEHTAHAIKRGPDGFLYVLCGNETGIDKSYNTDPKSALIPDPIAGCILRISPDFKNTQVLAHGFRNPYSMDFSAAGDLFTFDSDNERCVSLPWYEPTRFLLVGPGCNYGWRSPQLSETWRAPSYFTDVIPACAELGRGSPTGVVCYKGTQFPPDYRNGFFVCDWTFGTVQFLKLRDRFDALYFGGNEAEKPSIFLRGVGEAGFAPTSIDVHRESGDLYVTSGGRGTRGAVFRIVYQGSNPPPNAPGQSPAGTLPPPGSFVDPDLGYVRAKEMIWEVEEPKEPWRKGIINDPPLPGGAIVKQALIRMQLCAARNAISKVDATTKPSPNDVTECWRILVSNPNLVLKLAAEALREQKGQKQPESSYSIQYTLEAIRVSQLAVGDIGDPKAKASVWEGYTARKKINLDGKEVRDSLNRIFATFPFPVASINREITRLAAMLEYQDPALVAKMLGELTSSIDPVDDIHYLIVLARMGEPRTKETRDQILKSLLLIDRRLDLKGAKRDLHWPMRMKELFAGLVKNDPMVGKELVRTPFFGAPVHAIYASSPFVDRVEAANAFQREIRFGSKEISWTPAAVAFLRFLPSEKSFPAARSLYENVGLQGTVLSILSQSPEEIDRQKFVDGLASIDGETRKACAFALGKLPITTSQEMAFAVFKAYVGSCQASGAAAAAEKGQLHQLLLKISGKSESVDSLVAWSAWMTAKYPQLAVKLLQGNSVDLAKWNRRLQGIDWNKGQLEQGKKLFRKLSCIQCHSGSSAVGPDLAGAANRFSKPDLFRAIVAPNAEVSARYRSSIVELEDGEVRRGIIIYDAVDSLILQTSAEKTVRVPVDQIVSRKMTASSIMPEGLLDHVNDQEIADIFSYIKSLSK